jgi:hypothetical protein
MSYFTDQSKPASLRLTAGAFYDGPSLRHLIIPRHRSYPAGSDLCYTWQEARPLRTFRAASDNAYQVATKASCRLNPYE